MLGGFVHNDPFLVGGDVYPPLEISNSGRGYKNHLFPSALSFASSSPFHHFFTLH
jgi:hypothetical protein